MDWAKVLTELNFRTSRSSGAGGQHVNKTETKVEALLDVRNAEGLSEEEKIILLEKLSNRISEEGLLAVSSQKSRSQSDNKGNAIEKMQALMEKALLPVVKRIKTKPSRASNEERLTEKKINAEKKEARKKPGV